MNKQVWAEVVTIGSELVLGQLVDTNAAFIARGLAEIGVGLAYHTTVGDDRELMVNALRTAMDRCRIVIATGGLGPTEDDLTREVAAEVLGTELELRQDLLEYIESLFARMSYTMADNNKRQAYIPKGARVIHNPRGTAPAFLAEQGDRVLICLPGVPFETEPLIGEEILPFIKEKYNLAGRVWINRVLKVCGVGESNVDSQIKEIIRSSENPIIGLQASPGEIKVRLTAKADSLEEAEKLLDQAEERVKERLGDLIFGYGDETLAGNAAALIREKGLTLAVADAMTKGRTAAELGGYLDSEWFRGGVITNNVLPASQMAENAFQDFGVDIVLAVAGFPTDDGHVNVEIYAGDKNGGKMERTLVLGGPERLTSQRAATMVMFSLWRFLNEMNN